MTSKSSFVRHVACTPKGAYGAQTIKVIGHDRMCFRVDAQTLEPLSCSVYDAYAFSDPETVPSMGINEWQVRRNEMFYKGLRSGL